MGAMAAMVFMGAHGVAKSIVSRYNVIA
jgi:hypothetical protein